MDSTMAETMAGADERISKLEAARENLRAMMAQIDKQVFDLGGDINDAYEHRDEMRKLFDERPEST